MKKENTVEPKPDFAEDIMIFLVDALYEKSDLESAELTLTDIAGFKQSYKITKPSEELFI